MAAVGGRVVPGPEGWVEHGWAEGQGRENSGKDPGGGWAAPQQISAEVGICKDHIPALIFSQGGSCFSSNHSSIYLLRKRFHF